MTKRDEIRRRFEALSSRPARWADSRSTSGDFDGRATTLEIFNVESAAQRQLYRALREARRVAENELGAPLLLIFHRPEDTSRFYSWVLNASAPRPLEVRVPLQPQLVAPRVHTVRASRIVSPFSIDRSRDSRTQQQCLWSTAR